MSCSNPKLHCTPNVRPEKQFETKKKIMPQLTFIPGLTLPSFLTTRLRAFGSWQKKVKFRRTFRDIFAENGWFCGKFTEISTTNFAERWSEGNWRFCGIFLGTFLQKRIGFALIWQTSLTKKRLEFTNFCQKMMIIRLYNHNSTRNTDYF